MAFGHFAAGFADAFTETLMLKKEQERKDKMAKLQGQLVELQMKSAENQLNAQTQVNDMMSGNTLGEFDIPQFAGADETGMQPVAPGTAQNIVPQQAPGVGEPMGLEQMIQSPEGLSALMASGQLKMGDLIPRQGSPNRTLEMLDAAGIDPASEEGKQAMFGQDDDIFTKMLLQNQLEQERLKLEERQREREKNERTEAQRVRGVKVDAKRDIDHSREMFELMERLDGTVLAVGNPAGEFLTTGKAGLNALMEMTGFDVGKARQLVADRRRLEKLFADGTLGALDRFQGTGTVSGAKFEALQKATPNAAVPSTSNMLLLADRLEQLLAAADIEQIDIPEREEALKLVEALRGYRPASVQPAVDGPGVLEDVQVSIDEIKKMGAEQIEKLNRAALSPEQKAALKARIAELLNES